MNMLYRFWTYFLRDNYNVGMYEDFKRTAKEDLEAGMPYGMECMFRFYSYGIQKAWNPALYNDFEQAVLEVRITCHIVA